MGIQIIFYSTRIATVAERIIDRVRACYDAVDFFNRNLFHPEEIQVWFDASSEALGGRLVKQIPLENLHADSETLYQYLLALPFSDLNKSIIIYSGKWVASEIELGGYFSVQNQEEWRKTYGDLTISAYARKEFEDLVDFLWALENARQTILEFVKTLARPKHSLSVRTAQISFSHGIYSDEDPTNLMALYLSGERRSLLRIFYKALLASNDAIITMKSKPLETRFLIETLINNSIVTKRIDSRLERDLVDEIRAGSALYFGKERDSFQKLFQEISEAILKPAFNKLPEAKIVEQMIDEGIREFKDKDEET